MIGVLAIAATVLAAAETGSGAGSGSGSGDAEKKGWLAEQFNLVRVLEGPLPAYQLLWGFTQPRQRKRILIHLAHYAQMALSLAELQERVEELEAAINAWQITKRHPSDPPALARVLDFTGHPITPGKAPPLSYSLPESGSRMGLPWFRETRNEGDLDFVTGIFLPSQKKISGDIVDLPDLVEVAVADHVEWRIPGENVEDLAREAGEANLVGTHLSNRLVLRTGSLLSADANEALITDHPKFLIPGGNRAYRRIPLSWLVRDTGRATRF